MSHSEAGLERYQELIDELVKRREGVLPVWIREKGWPRLPENETVNAFLSKLTSDEKDVVVQMVREARDSGIHDVLVLMQELMDRNGLRLFIDGEELPVSPHGTEIFWDWTSRADGAPWPAPPSKER